MENQFRIRMGTRVRCNLTTIIGTVSNFDNEKGYEVTYSDDSHTWFTFAYLSKNFTVVGDVEFPKPTVKPTVTEMAKKAKEDIENILQEFENKTGLSVYMTYNSEVGSEDRLFSISAKFK